MFTWFLGVMWVQCGWETSCKSTRGCCCQIRNYQTSWDQRWAAYRTAFRCTCLSAGWEVGWICWCLRSVAVRLRMARARRTRPSCFTMMPVWVRVFVAGLWWNEICLQRSAMTRLRILWRSWRIRIVIMSGWKRAARVTVRTKTRKISRMMTCRHNFFISEKRMFLLKDLHLYRLVLISLNRIFWTYLSTICDFYGRNYEHVIDVYQVFDICCYYEMRYILAFI